MPLCNLPGRLVLHLTILAHDGLLGADGRCARWPTHSQDLASAGGSCLLAGPSLSGSDSFACLGCSRILVIDVSHLSPLELLALHAQVADELRARGITRSSNNPTGDLAECLFCKAFGWKQAGNSNANVDAVGADGTTKYQIKGRRVTRYNKSRQLSAIRDLTGEHFDFLAGVLFGEDYSVVRAAIIPRSVVIERAVFITRTNSHKFILRDDVWDAPGVRDVTSELRAVNLAE